MANKTKNSKVGKKAAKDAKKAAKKAQKSKTKVDRSNTPTPIRHFLPRSLMTRRCWVRSMATRALWLACLFGIIGQPATASDSHSLAAIYSQKGGRTASGELYSPAKLTAAHRSLRFGTFVRVTNLKNHRTVIVRINDRGPFNKGRIIDLSRAAAHQLGFSGVVPVTLDVVAAPQ